jgi:hypothetical protein
LMIFTNTIIQPAPVGNMDVLTDEAVTHIDT